MFALMRCLSCHYELKNLPQNRCPECGRAFDPTNPVTFYDPPKIAWKILLRNVAILVSAFAAFVWLFLLGGLILIIELVLEVLDTLF